jgi:hypothetical protein
LTVQVPAAPALTAVVVQDQRRRERLRMPVETAFHRRAAAAPVRPQPTLSATQTVIAAADIAEVRVAVRAIWRTAWARRRRYHAACFVKQSDLRFPIDASWGGEFNLS